ncbi:MAG TPA: DUF1992 domain-containing protein [Tepidisphaeraceae bacterium]|jgi:hypothetical protein
MSPFKQIDMEGALRRLADRRIEEAMKEGKFDNLPGRGKPLDLEPMPAEEEARLLWWALRIMRSNDVVPDEVRWRKMIDTLKEELLQTRNEKRVKVLVTQINALVHRVNTLGTNALKTAVTGVQMEIELERLRDRQDESTSARR